MLMHQEDRQFFPLATKLTRPWLWEPLEKPAHLLPPNSKQALSLRAAEVTFSFTPYSAHVTSWLQYQEVEAGGGLRIWTPLECDGSQMGHFT